MNNKNAPELVSLENQLTDYVAAAAKSIVGEVPFAGSLLVEIAGGIIPNQRIERIAKFASILDSKIAHLERASIRAKVTDENFTDLAEEAMKQAARSITNERREYIASVRRIGLCEDALQHLPPVSVVITPLPSRRTSR